MPTTTVPMQSPAPNAPRRRLTGPIVLATDGAAQSAGAFAAAVAIAAGGTRRNEHAERLAVRVVTVCDALPVVVPEIAPVLPHEFLEGRRSDMRAAALEQVRYNVADTSKWSVDALTGPAAPTIAETADEMGASLIVMGLGKHDLYERVFGSETALRVMQRSRVPVLAVPQNWIGIPRSLLVAVDFGAASLRAAQTAMRIIAPGGSACFAHVAPDIGLPGRDGDDLATIYQANLDDEFDRFIAAAGVPDGVAVTRTALYGDPARTLLDRARHQGVDMIVAGTHGLNALARLFVGSVASKLVRGTQCALLVAAAATEQHDESEDG
ncbi:MAG TPA: universal stress protein [Gemmatimonadaceae bacterium]|nr:universal stress protein [Gemmatimonadaceae bacterium]